MLLTGQRTNTMERVKAYFIARNATFLVDRIHVFAESSATVELAAQCLQCNPANIAKSITFTLTPTLSKEENKQRQKAKAAAGANQTALPTAGPPTPTVKPNKSIVIVTAGDAKVNSKKFKAKFQCSPRMCKREEVEEAVGFPAGGVCPFALHDDVLVYLDVSLKRFEKVYPACGTSNTGIPLHPEELQTYAMNFVEWVDVCEGWQTQEATDAKAEMEATNATTSTKDV